MTLIQDNIQYALMVPRIPHMPNKDGSIDRLRQITLSAESCYQVRHIFWKPYF